MKNTEDPTTVEYPVMIHKVEDSDDSYYMAYLPDFGMSTCSAVGDTMTEALEALEGVKQDVIVHFIESGHEIPTPSKCPMQKRDDEGEY